MLARTKSTNLHAPQQPIVKRRNESRKDAIGKKSEWQLESHLRLIQEEFAADEIEN